MTQPGGYEGPLAEFGALRTEIENRAQRQQNLLTLQITAVAAIFSFALSQSRYTGILLTVPVISYLFCGRYASQHYGMARVGVYILDELSDRIPGGLHWEQWIRTQGQRTDRTTNWKIPLLLTFPGSSLISETWVFSYIFTRQPASVLNRAFLIGVWLAGVMATGLCIYLVLGMLKNWHGNFRRPGTVAKP
jgi:hypothetical protein